MKQTELASPISLWETLAVAKSKIPVLPISPITLACPFCDAKPGRDCETSSGGFSLVHVQRIKAAAKVDAANKRKREEFSKSAAGIAREAAGK